MTQVDFIDILEKEGEKLANRQCVLQLCSKDASDYDRGRIKGQIEMITKIMIELTRKDDDDENSFI